MEPSHQRFDSNADYEAALDQVISCARRSLRIFDKTLSREYNSVRRYELLRGFLLASRGNRLLIAVHHAEAIRRDCPRLVNLLHQFSHAISVHRTLPAAKRAYDPFMLADEEHYAHRFHYDQPGSVLSLGDLAGGRELYERFEEIWEASTPAVTATTLGL
jgi:hypothetical protein